MTDTSPVIAELVRRKLMERSAEERFLMGIGMFDAARQMVLASLPQGLPDRELRRQLFLRLYGYPAPFLEGNGLTEPAGPAYHPRAEAKTP